MRYIYADDVSYQNKFDSKTGNTIQFPEHNIEMQKTYTHLQIVQITKIGQSDSKTGNVIEFAPKNGTSYQNRLV